MQFERESTISMRASGRSSRTISRARLAAWTVPLISEDMKTPATSSPESSAAVNVAAISATAGWEEVGRTGEVASRS